MVRSAAAQVKTFSCVNIFWQGNVREVGVQEGAEWLTGQMSSLAKCFTKNNMEN
jgi:hypothetical protein